MPNLTPRQARTGMFAFLVLCFGVTTNILVLQDGSPGARQLKPGFGVGPEITPRRSVAPMTGQGKAEGAGHWKTRVRTKVLQDPARGLNVPRRSGALPPAHRPWGRGAVKAPASKTTTGALAPVQTNTIRAIQRELAGRGYQAGQIDGIAGLMTRAAIMAFEYDQGLVLTAMPTQAVLHQILLGQRASGPVGRSLRAKYNQHARRVIDTIQQSLVRLRYMRPPRGSLLSEDTERAIREFEMDQGLIATGRISGKLVAALARASRSATRPRAPK